jgi:hypothetical protein
MGALSQALEIIFEVQSKNNKKKKKLFNLQNMLFFFFSFLWTPPTFKPHNFLISYSFKMILSVIKASPEVLQIIFEL